MNIREKKRISVWSSIDWITIIIYLLLLALGWLSVCGASYEYGDPDFLDFTTRSGKQFIWMMCALGVAFVLLMLDEGIYVIGFYYPVVPKDKARIRVQISAGHSKEHIDKAIAAFTKVGKELGVIK